jgi:hypothetical protein
MGRFDCIIQLLCTIHNVLWYKITVYYTQCIMVQDYCVLYTMFYGTRLLCTIHNVLWYKITMYYTQCIMVQDYCVLYTM